MAKPSERDLKLYAACLYERREQGVILSWAEVSVGDWSPRPNECHQNVTDFCALDERFSAVRGWLYRDYGGLLTEVEFVAHSAVRDAPRWRRALRWLLPARGCSHLDGPLYDITPSHGLQQYPFIAAEESEAEFQSLIESGVSELFHVK